MLLFISCCRMQRNGVVVQPLNFPATKSVLWYVESTCTSLIEENVGSLKQVATMIGVKI